MAEEGDFPSLPKNRRAREQRERRRRQRILATAFVSFLSVAAGSLSVLRTEALSARSPTSAREVDRKLAAEEARSWLSKVNDPTLDEAEAARAFIALSEIQAQFPLFKGWMEKPLLDVLRDSQSRVRRDGSLRVLSQIRGTRTLAWLKEQSDSGARIPAWALEPYLGSARDPIARDLLWKIAKDEKRAERADAIQILIRHRDSRAPELLRQSPRSPAAR